MARTWRNERTTPKKDRQQGTKRPRMNDFARDWYQSHGYTVDAYCDAPMGRSEEVVNSGPCS